MSTFNYARSQATAKRLITKFGQQGTIKRIAPPDPLLGGDGTETSYTADIVPVTYDQRLIDGANILASDRQIMISSVGLEIVLQPNDIVTVSGVDYLIINVDPNNYDGVTNVFFVCQGRII